MQFQLAPYFASLSMITSVEIMTALLFQFLKGHFTQVKNSSSFIQSHVIPNMYDILLKNTKAYILKNAPNIFCISQKRGSHKF